MSQSLLFYHHVDFSQIKKRARELLKAFRAGEKEALTLFAKHHPALSPNEAKLADAQFALARDFDYPSWPRFKIAAELVNAIRTDNAEQVISLIRKHPKLLSENVFGQRSNWGPPLAVAAQLDTPKVFKVLVSLEGQNIDFAFSRAVLQGNVAQARQLFEKGAKPEKGEIMGPCESLNPEGMRFLMQCGAEFEDDSGNSLAPIALLLEGYHRFPKGKHQCLEYCVEIGKELPDTPMMAFHRGRIDLLEKHLTQNPKLLNKRFSYHDIYPLELGCHEDKSLGLHGTPLEGTTLLHMAMDFDEVEIAHWLLEKEADVNALAESHAEGFGGHTPLFNIVVSQSYLSGRQGDGKLAQLLLQHGANSKIRASIQKGIRFIADETVYQYSNLTALEYGHAFRHKRWVSQPALSLLEKSG
ncbi:ankyrin repeat domain-containing protein [Alteromonadaceae bacterium M269]|nr:ankyrin repeat domain-containing protein [Alteromonadaceae bacterium M269]